MNWWHPRRRIDRALLGLLTPTQEAALRAHLGRCPRCRAAYDEGVLLLRAAHGGGDAAGLGELERMVRRASALATHPPRPARALLARRWVLAPVAVALGALLLVLFGGQGPVGAVFELGQELLIDGQAAALHQPIPSGALVEAVRGDSALLLEGRRSVLLRQGARARITAGGEEAVLEAGRARFSVRPGQGPFAVVADDARVEVHGTIFVVERRAGQQTLVAVHRGEVRVLGRAAEVTLKEGQESVVSRGEPCAPRPARAESLEEDRGGDLLDQLKRAWRQLLRALDRAVGE